MRLYVSSTRPAPHNGLLSRAASPARDPKLLGLAGKLNRPFDESSIHLGINETLPKGDERSEAPRRLLGIQTIQHQLPPPIHQRRLNDLITGVFHATSQQNQFSLDAHVE